MPIAQTYNFASEIPPALVDQCIDYFFINLFPYESLIDSVEDSNRFLAGAHGMALVMKNFLHTQEHQPSNTHKFNSKTNKTV